MDHDDPNPMTGMPDPGQASAMATQERDVALTTGSLVTNAVAMFGADAAFSVVLSRVSREVRRADGVEGARQMFARLAHAMPETDDNLNWGASVRVPGSRFRMGPAHKALWDMTGTLVTCAIKELGRDAAFAVILERVSADVRAVVGAKATKALLQGMADSMAEAAEYDR